MLTDQERAALHFTTKAERKHRKRDHRIFLLKVLIAGLPRGGDRRDNLIDSKRWCWVRKP